MVFVDFDFLVCFLTQWKSQGFYLEPGARPTNDISIEFEIRPKVAMLWFKMYSTDHNEILHTARQCNCHINSYFIY